ncbi:MAG: hypothetical protein EOM23_01755 [Candidatus Moranbacteria bacterium]|nr:hypothetical protein [Candidatus Moranbacteria bacterium]
MKTIEINLYKFDELSEEAKNTVLERHWDINVDYEWWDGVYMDAENIGLKITGFDIDRGSFCNCEFIEDPQTVANKIMEDHGPDCETYKDAGRFLLEYKRVLENAEKDEDEEFLDEYEVEQELEELEDEFLYTLSEDYRIMLQKEYEYLTGEEAIKETLIINEYDFTEDGEIY